MTTMTLFFLHPYPLEKQKGLTRITENAVDIILHDQVTIGSTKNGNVARQFLVNFVKKSLHIGARYFVMSVFTTANLINIWIQLKIQLQNKCYDMKYKN